MNNLLFLKICYHSNIIISNILEALVGGGGYTKTKKIKSFDTGTGKTRLIITRLIII